MHVPRRIEHCDGACLLPGQNRAPVVALFWRRGDVRSEAMLARFVGVSWPRSHRVCAVELRGAGDVCAFLGLGDEPLVAILRDGMVLALDQDCDRESCGSLLALAQRQAESLDEL